VAMLTLALGVGANTTIFSVIDNTLLEPPPFPNADRLVLVWETFGEGPDNWNIVSAPRFWDFQRLSHAFETMAIFDPPAGAITSRRRGIGRRRNKCRACACRRASFPCWARSR